MDRPEQVRELTAATHAAVLCAVWRGSSACARCAVSGKTTTVVELVVQCVARGERVLACAPSNIAVDNLVERITAAAAYNAAHQPKPAASSSSSSTSSSPFHSFRCIRVGHPARLSAAVLSHSLDSVVRHSDGGSIARDVEADMATTQQQLNRTRDKGEKKALRSQFHALQKELRQRQRKAVQDVLDSAPVTCTTLTGAASSSLSSYRYDTVVVDEAAQAVEVAVLIPALLCKRRLVLAGDHHQLGPVVKSREAMQAGMGATVMDRLSRRADSEQLMCMLSLQYRMNAEIMGWSSGEFYSGGLQAPDAVLRRRLTDIPGVKADELTQAAMLFIDTAGCDMREDEDERAAASLSSPLFSQSKSNQHEVALVQQHVSRLLARHVPLSSITVLSPYLAQLSLLRDALLPLHPQLEVGTIDSMQGRENDVVIISCVRSNAQREVGFLSESRRMNVAITRAKRQACIIADSDTLSSDPFLQRLVDFLVDNDSVELISAAHYLQGDDALVYAQTAVPARPAPAAQSAVSSVAELSRPASSVTRKHAAVRPETSAAAEAEAASEPAGAAQASARVVFDRQRVRDICAELLTGALASFSFPASLSAEDRRLVHEVAEEEGAGRLQHDSEGRGHRRVITLSLLQPATIPPSPAAPASDPVPASQRAVATAEAARSAKAANADRNLRRAAAVARMEAAAKPHSGGQEQQRSAVRSGNEERQRVVAVASPVAAVSPQSTELLDEEEEEAGGEDDADASEEAAEGGSDSATVASAQPAPDSDSARQSRRAKGGKKAARAAASAAAGEDDDKELDGFLSSLSKGVSVCASPACSAPVTVNGALCRFCRLRFCFAHCNSILHGCAAEAKDAGLARDRLSLQAAQQGRTGRPLKDDKRKELSAKLQSKAGELRRSGEADSKKKKQGSKQERKAA